MSSHNCWENALQLANVVFRLAGAVRTWFENHKACIQGWDTCRTTIATSFAVSNNRPRLSSDLLATRAQHKNESFTAIIEDVLWLCRRANPDVENEKRPHLTKGVAEAAFQFLIAKSPSSVTNISATCKTFEDARRSRLKKSLYQRLANAPPLFSCPAADALDIRALVHEVVCEELRVVLPEYYPSSFNGRPPDISLKEAITNDVRAAFSNLPKLSPEEFRDGAQTHHRPPTPNVVASYFEVQREPNIGFVTPPYYHFDQPQPHTHEVWVPPDHSKIRRRTDIWRSDDFRPTCFCCTRPGHVYRFCRHASMTCLTPGAATSLLNAITIDTLPSATRYCSPSRNRPTTHSRSPSQRCGLPFLLISQRCGLPPP